MFTLLLSLFLGSSTAGAADDFPGSCLDFDGINDFVDLSTVSGSMAGEDTFTWSAWLRLPANLPHGERAALFSVNGRVLVCAEGLFGFQNRLAVYEGAFQSQEILAGSVPVGSWVQVSYVRSGSLGYLYMDGELLGLHTANYSFLSSDTWSLGRYGSISTDLLEGQLDEIELWTVARTEEQLRLDMHRTLVGSENGLTGYWQGNGSGSILLDNAGSNDGQLENGTGRIESTLSIGGGQSALLDLASASEHALPALGILLGVESTTGSPELVVTHLSEPPNQGSPLDQDYDQQLWVLRHYNGGSYELIPRVMVGEGIDAPDLALPPSDFRWLQRDAGSAGGWSEAARGTALDEAADRIAFNAFGEEGQFMVARDTRDGLLALSPMPGALEVPVMHSLELEFDTAMQPGSGSIHLLRVEDDSLLHSFPALSLDYDGNRVIADLPAPAEFDAEYKVQVDADALQDGMGQFFEGITEDGAWSFRTTPWFVQEDWGLPALQRACHAAGDVDGDGDLDLFVAGDDGSQLVGGLYLNSGSAFLPGQELLAVESGSAAWSDVDRDGDLDLLVSGDTTFGGTNAVYVTRLYLNQEGLLIDSGQQLPGSVHGSVLWTDLDGDGSEDLVMTGSIDGSGWRSQLYWNREGSLVHSGLLLPEAIQGRARSGDLDGDGDADLLLFGFGLDSSGSYALFQDDGQLDQTTLPVPLSFDGDARIADLDGDGDADILGLGGNEGWRLENQGGVYAQVPHAFGEWREAGCDLGDADLDGALDLLIAGKPLNENRSARLYLNRGGSLQDTGLRLGSAEDPLLDASWIDLDRDGDLDALFIGPDSLGVSRAQVVLNQWPGVNQAPLPPTNLQLTQTMDGLALGWDAGLDAETPAAQMEHAFGLSLNGETLVSLPGLSDGTRFHSAPGNAFNETSWRLPSVRGADAPLAQEVRLFELEMVAIDGARQASARTSLQVDLSSTEADLWLQNEPLLQADGRLSWELRDFLGTASHRLQVSSDSLFATVLVDTLLAFQSPAARDIALSVTLDELADPAVYGEDQPHYWRVQPFYADAWRQTRFGDAPASFVYSNGNAAPLPPQEGFNPAGGLPVFSLLPRIGWANAEDAEDGADALRYEIQLDSSAIFAAPLWTEISDPGRTYSDVGMALEEGRLHHYRLRTLDSEGLVSDWSAINSFRPLLPPQNLAAQSDGQQLNLSWDALPAVPQGTFVYTVYAADSPAARFPAEWQALASVTQESYTEAVTEGPRFYRITAALE